jgi:hypothetical protein
VTCIQPGASTAEDLMACADGNAGSAIMRHVSACDHCAAEVAAYARAQNRLRYTFYRITCPSAEVFGDYELGLVSDAERVAIAGHVLDCPRCAEELHVLREFLAPDAAVRPAEVGALGRLVRMVASAFVPPMQPGLGALRGSVDNASGNYRAGALAIKITQTSVPRSSGRVLVGLVWQDDNPDAELSGEARLFDEGGDSRSTPIDRFGNFTFEHVGAGMYHVELQIEMHVTVVEELRVTD